MLDPSTTLPGAQGKERNCSIAQFVRGNQREDHYSAQDEMYGVFAHLVSDVGENKNQGIKSGTTIWATPTMIVT